MNDLFETYTDSTNEPSLSNQGVGTSSATDIPTQNQKYVFEFFGLGIEQWHLEVLEVALKVLSVALTLLIIARLGR